MAWECLLERSLKVFDGHLVNRITEKIVAIVIHPIRRINSILLSYLKILHRLCELVYLQRDPRPLGGVESVDGAGGDETGQDGDDRDHDQQFGQSECGMRIAECGMDIAQPNRGF